MDYQSMGHLLVKDYNYGDLFYLSLHDDVCNRVVNIAIIPDE